MARNARDERVAGAELGKFRGEVGEEPLHAQAQQRIRHVAEDANRRRRGMVVPRHHKVVWQQVVAAAKRDELERVRRLVPSIAAKSLVVERQHRARTDHKRLKAFPGVERSRLLKDSVSHFDIGGLYRIT